MTQRRSSLVDDDGSMEKAPEQTAEEKDDDNDDEEDHHRRQGDSGRGSLSNESRDSGSFKSGKDRISPASECSNSAEFTSSVDSVRNEALERLCHAIQNKETPLDHVSLLVEGLSASELNTPSQDFQLTPLMIAAIAKRCDVVEVLLQKGAHPDVPTESHVMLTALLLACCHSCVCADVMSVVRVLRWWGADLNVQDIHGCTPLCFAMERGNKELISYLLKHGAMKTDDHDHPSQQHH
nr:hypothetical protein BaRGS_005116 [Batillaria attramentaria]